MVLVAVVGVGGMGTTHLNNISNMKNVKIDAICDPNPAVASTAARMCASYCTDVDELLKQTNASIIMIFSPTFCHAKQIEAVLRSGRHCISEKPLCLSSRQASALYSLADQMNVCLYVAQVLHFTSEYQMLERLIQSHQYGSVIDAFFFRLSQQPKWLTGNWLFDPEKSGLIPYDLHIHELDFIISQFGKPVIASRQQAIAAEPQREHYRFLYEYADKTICAEASWYKAPFPFTHGFRICFEQAIVTYEQNRLLIFERDMTEGKIVIEEQTEEGTAINVKSALPYRLEMEHFIQCAIENKESSIVKRENVLAVLEVLDTLCGNASQPT